MTTASSKSRRERPSKPALSREWIVAETIKIVRDEGLEKATMRRVAQALDTGPASLYVYIANTTELHAAVLDELIGTVDLDRGSIPWRRRLDDVLAGYGSLLFAYPGLARSALVAYPHGPNAIRLYDLVLGLLLEAGTEADRAAWGVDLLLGYVTANAAEHSEPVTDLDITAGREIDALFNALRSADAATAPHVAAHADALVSGTGGERVRWAIDVLLRGITATPIPPEVSDGR